LFVWIVGFVLLHVGAGEKLLISHRQESSSLSESSGELSFASTQVVVQVGILAQARVVSPTREGLA